MKKLRYVVTGTGRSGTVYMAKLLTSMGVPCGHECVFNRFGADSALSKLQHPEYIRTSLVSGDSWLPPGDQIVADSSYMAAPYLNETFLSDTQVIHAVRHPLRVISSFVKDLEYFLGTEVKSSYETFIYSSIPELYREMSAIERACIFYVRWNQMIENFGQDGTPRYFRYRVEEKADVMLKFLNEDMDLKSIFINRKANTMQTGKRPFLLKDLPEGQSKKDLIEMGERYGYDMDLKLKLF